MFGNTFAQTQLAAKKIGSDEDLWTGQVMKFLSVGGNARANYSYSDVPQPEQPPTTSRSRRRAPIWISA